MNLQHPSEEKRPPCVAVGMSGGVDSTVAAALLLEAGYRVIGLTMLIWDAQLDVTGPRRSGCFGPGEAEDLARAQAMAAQLGIPHHTVRLTAEFRQTVLAHYQTEYLRGRTPNPCALCNPAMKFDALPRQARAQGIAFDWFATGHYARILPPAATGGFRLCRGRDHAKDQSYFLARLSQAQLAGTRLPLGDRTKDDVRRIARSLGLDAAADAAESQDFFEGEDHGVLFDPRGITPGPIVDADGRRIGTHRGIIYYMVGQRQGLGVAAGHKLYVQRICAQTNTIVLADREAVLRRECRIRALSWISGSPPPPGTRCLVRLRYRHAGVMAVLCPCLDEPAVWHGVLDEPQFAVAPGQMAVFYDGEDVLGGGWIDE